MTTVADSRPALIQIAGLRKQYSGLRPLRVDSLSIGAGDRIALGGLDAGAAEMLILLITGAAVPDEGQVLIDGHDTREIATDTEWLLSLDRFGVVTERAVLIDALSIASNLALPMSLSIDPMPEAIRQKVDALADDVGLASERLDHPAATLTQEERVLLHLARAMAPGPQLLLLEHPTGRVEDAASSERLGHALRRASDARNLGWLAITEDAAFARAAAATRLRLKPATGVIDAERRWFWR